MTTCCICGNTVRNTENNIFELLVGDPPKLISDIVNEILADAGHCYEFSQMSLICIKCSGKIARFYKVMVVAEQLKSEIIDSIKSSFEEQCKIVEAKEIFEDNEELLLVTETAEDEEQSMEYMKMEYEVLEDEEEFLGDDFIQHPDIEISASSLQDIDNIGQEDDYLVELDNADTNNTATAEENDPTICNNSNPDKREKMEKFEVQKCNQCDKILKSRRDYNTHMQREHFQGYICDQCGKTLYSYSGFLNHRVTHDPVKKFECNVCGAKYYHKQALKHHMAWHNEDKPYQCEICSKQFVHRLGLRRHMVIHDSNSRKIACEVCGNKFRTNAHLTRHMRSHTGAKPFSCPICGKCFTQNYNLTVHIKEHQEPGSTRQRRLRCKKCSRTFTNSLNYKHHCENGDCMVQQETPPVIGSEITL